jgi:hypothetical protein
VVRSRSMGQLSDLSCQFSDGQTYVAETPGAGDCLLCIIVPENTMLG